MLLDAADDDDCAASCQITVSLVSVLTKSDAALKATSPVQHTHIHTHLTALFLGLPG